MEDSVQKKGNFNMSKKPRVDYQSGPDEQSLNYQIKHRLFLTCKQSEYCTLSQEKYPDVHPWLIDAVNNNKDKRLALNLPLPSHLEYRENNQITLLSECQPSSLLKGDIVVITFRLGFYVGPRNWTPEIMPEEFIRVERVHNRLYGDIFTQTTNWPQADVKHRLAPGKIERPISSMLYHSSKKCNSADTIY